MEREVRKAINDINSEISISLMKFYKKYPNYELVQTSIEKPTTKIQGTSPWEDKTFIELVFDKVEP